MAGSLRPVRTAVQHWADGLEAAAAAVATPERAEQEKRYLKSELVHLGASVPALDAVVKAFLRDHPSLDHDALVALVEELWSRPVHERRAMAVMLLERRVDALGPADLPLLERLLRESRTWALVDDLAACVVGPLAGRCPEVRDGVDAWIADPDFWLRRSALLSYLLVLRAGGGDFERFATLADRVLGEREFFVRKAIGWVLRDTARRRPEVVAAWLAPRTARAAGLTVREAAKRLPPDVAAELVAAQREGRAAHV